MNQILNPDELFNLETRNGDRETPLDRFHDLILAIFRSTVSEACRQYAEYPNREPDSGLVLDAAAWIQELMMPDVCQRDIARRIALWIVSQNELQCLSQHGNSLTEQSRQSAFVGYM